MSTPVPAPIQIRHPLTLLYWLFLRPLSLRRYARSIHPDLDEDLKVWEVRREVGDDPRFRALCRARWWLLATVPLLGTTFVGLIFSLWDDFRWLPALLHSSGWTVGILTRGLLAWRFPQQTRRWWWNGAIILLLWSVLIILSVLPLFMGIPAEALIEAVFIVALGVALGVAWAWRGYRRNRSLRHKRGDTADTCVSHPTPLRVG
ncbi:MAG: hypothetical protein HC911_17745 [Chloroflexaceae bacterium]|nr:hypothetical protein [Chloroflexaceae bacterium]